MSRDQILSSALLEFEMFSRAKLIKSGVLKEARGTFSTTPGLDKFRPQTEDRTSWTILGRGLDRNGMAFNYGGCRPQRAASRRCTGRRC
jgi:hypothetical protein